MRLVDWASVVVIGLAVYVALRRTARAPEFIRVEQVAPDYIPGIGAAPPGMEWDVNFAGEWVPVAKL